MNVSARRRVWLLLSDLFVDTEWSDEELRAIGAALKQTGFSANEVEAILRGEVAPVCGRWMRWPSIGPWPAFDSDWVNESVEKYLHRPPFFRLGLWGLPGVRRDWKVVRDAMES